MKRLLSLTIPCPACDPLALWQQGEGGVRLYWQDSREQLAAVGAAAELTAWGEARWEQLAQGARQLFAAAEIISPHPEVGPRLFGGLAFSDDFAPDYRWSAFAPAHFILPHYQLTILGDAGFLTLNTLIGSDEATSSLVAELKQALCARLAGLSGVRRGQAPTVAKLDDPLGLARWRTMVEAATARIAAGELRKVVLARPTELRFVAPPDLSYPLAALRARYPSCTTFAIEPRAGHAFLGATPEQLLELRGQRLRTMALAGSIARGASPTEDAALARQLLADPKERHEHQLVLDALRARLAPLARALEVGPTEVMQLSNIQHLYTPLATELRAPADALALLKLLHPTPALGGAPTEVALALIRELEPLPRGWFAAPVGYLTPELGGRFAVAIRSAVVQRERAWLFAGAGIVAASEPEREWQETALKFRPMLEAFAVEPVLSGAR